jgi:class 3 adenylate cyclase/tetratricopeptide (TPR) repeat protein
MPLTASKSLPTKTNDQIHSEIHIKPEQVDSPAAPDGERKTVTALFADIKGSTELMAELDPEEARGIVDPALKLMIEAVRRYDGYIVQSTGDGIFALFGAPLAHEDHPQRALYAALRMQEELRRYSARIVADGGNPIQCRVGANTGEVVVRSIATGEGHTEYTPIGHTTNLASRMQAVAPVGSIAVSDTTRHWCEGYFTFKSLGPTRLRGVQSPVEVHEVTGLGLLRTRLQRAVGRGLTKFVGRETELKQMKHAAELARDGHGQIVAAIGDPGVGKSRLLYEFKVTSQSGWKVLETVSISHGKASAYLPVIELLHNYFDISAQDDERKRREKVAGRIVMLDRALEDTIPYLLALLGITAGDDRLTQMDPQVRQRRAMEAIKRIVLRESLNQPLMVIFEDLHWLDAESQTVLNLLIESIGTARILLLVNYRQSEYRHEWGNKSYYTQLRLDPLGNDSAQAMLDALLSMHEPRVGQAFQPVVPMDSVAVSEDLTSLKHLILAKTEGNPFFIEEMVEELFEDGMLARNGTIRLAKPLSELKLPPAVQAVLASRIDRLPRTEKEVLQTLSVIGREFSQSLIARVTLHQADALTEMLADLQLAEFIYEQPALTDIEYTFKHALTQEVAYNSILLERRKQIHERAAEAIEALFESNLADYYADLVRHYVRSGNAAKAINYLHLAADQAISRSAYQEANANLTTALELLRTRPENKERDRTEIDLVLSLAMCMGVGAISGDLGVGMLEHALDLADKIGDDSSRLEILEFLAYQYSILPDQLTRARVLNKELLTSSERVQDSERVGWARSRLAWLSMHEGDFPAAIEELDQATRISIIPALPHRPRPLNWRLHIRAFASFALWVSGYPTRATVRAREAFEIVRRVSAAAVDRAFLCWWSCNLYLLLRDPMTAQGFSDEYVTLIAEHGLPGLAGTSVALRAWVLVQLGQIEAGLSQMLQHKSEIVDAGLVFDTWLFVALGNAYLPSGRASEGIATINEGLALCQSSRVRLLESELHRLKGELLLSAGNDEAAAQSFRDAIDLARHQGAKSWELRATTSLTQLLVSQGRRDEALTMLAKIYGWFTEGLDTADLKEAKALLDELSIGRATR